MATQHVKTKKNEEYFKKIFFVACQMKFSSCIEINQNFKPSYSSSLKIFFNKLIHFFGFKIKNLVGFG